METLVQNQTGKKVKYLRTDNGLEFCNHQFDKFCKDSGIERHRTCTYTSQQNGVAERMNKTIMDKVRCLLSESGLEEHFWAEAAATSVHLINKSPSSALEFKIPEEIWTGNVPSYHYLRRFGSLVFVHVSQGKLQPRANEGIFLGYPKGVKGYRVWLLEEKKNIISRDVIFKEDTMYKDLKENKSDLKSVLIPKKVCVTFRTDQSREQADSSRRGGASNRDEGGASEQAEEDIAEEDGKDHRESRQESTEEETEHEEESRQNLQDYLLARDREKNHCSHQQGLETVRKKKW